MASTIKIKRSGVAGKKPTTSDIAIGELALNTKDQKLFSSNGTSVFELASAGALANTNAYIATRAPTASPTFTGTLSAPLISVTQSLTNEGGQIDLALPSSGSTLTGTVAIDIYQNRLRIFETGGTNRGAYIDLTTASTGVGSNLLAGGGGSTSQYLQVSNANATFATKAYAAANSYVKSILANTNASIATQAARITLVNTNLLNTNTAIRALDNQKLSVANAVATYQTRAVERAALANTNSSIATQATRVTLVNTNLIGTNTALRTLISDRLQVANASTLYATRSNPATSGLLAHTGRATISTNLYVAGNTILGNPAVVTDRTIINGVTVANGQLSVSGNTVLSGTLVANNSAGISGYYLRTSGTGVYWSPVSGGGANGFSGILVGANVVSADSTTDRLTLVAGSGIRLAANPTTDTITISAAAANVVTKAVKDLTQNDTVVTSVSGVVAGGSSGITTGKAIAMAIVFGG